MRGGQPQLCAVQMPCGCSAVGCGQSEASASPGWEKRWPGSRGLRETAAPTPFQTRVRVTSGGLSHPPASEAHPDSNPSLGSHQRAGLGGPQCLLNGALVSEWVVGLPVRLGSPLASLPPPGVLPQAPRCLSGQSQQTDGRGRRDEAGVDGTQGHPPAPKTTGGSTERSLEGRGSQAEEGPGQSMGPRWPLGKGLGWGSGTPAWPLGTGQKHKPWLVA